MPLTALACGPMSLQGPIVVVGDQLYPELVAALGEAGAFPVVETPWGNASVAIAQIEPAAVVLNEPNGHPKSEMLALARAIEDANGPHMPVIARIKPGEAPTVATALPIAMDAPVSRIVARLVSASRVRILHATALRRADAFAAEIQDMPALPTTDPIEDATVMVLGRGGSYPDLAVAVGERVGLIGALSIETAARYLNERDVDGVMLGDGFGPRMVEAFLTVIAEDARFRDLPIAVLAGVPITIDRAQLPNLEQMKGEPNDVVERMLPLVRIRRSCAISSARWKRRESVEARSRSQDFRSRRNLIAAPTWTLPAWSAGSSAKPISRAMPATPRSWSPFREQRCAALMWWRAGLRASLNTRW